MMGLNLATFIFVTIVWTMIKRQQESANQISQVGCDSGTVIGFDEDEEIEEGRIGGGDVEVGVAEDEWTGELELAPMETTFEPNE
jgi:hypothetical protein